MADNNWGKRSFYAKGLSDDVKRVLGFVSGKPGIDMRGITWLAAGGEVEYKDGKFHLIGRTQSLSVAELNKVVNIKSRISEAKKGKLLKACDNLVFSASGKSSGTGLKLGDRALSVGFSPKPANTAKHKSEDVKTPAVSPEFAKFSQDDVMGLLD